MSKIENPFAGYGKMVHGKRFIGRKEIIQRAEDRINPDAPGNLAIIGVHRIGKSSLAYQTIIEQNFLNKDRLIDKRVLPIWIGLSSYDQSLKFFRSLVTRCIGEMKKLGWLTDEIQRLASQVSATEDSWDEIKDFFTEIHDTGYGTLFILDEFDHARYLFKGETAFQCLRELADYPDYGLSLVLTSRRSIGDIERLAGSSSPFHNIFQVERLAMFSNEDLKIYFSQFSSVGILMSDENREQVLFYCGAHPYLLEMLGCKIVEMFRQNQEIDIDKAADAKSIFEHYDDMIRLLREEGTFDKLIQILFSLAIDVKQIDVTELQSYGLIKLNEHKTYVAYSGHFHNYLLKLHEDSTELPQELTSIWSQTEQSLRKVITTTMSSAYGADWIDTLEKQRPNLKKIFDECRDRQKKSAFGLSNLIDFTYPSDVFDIICSKALWRAHFSKIFQQSTNYWEERKQFLAKCRTPLAHSYPHVLTSDQRLIFEGYCKEILRVCEKI